jgi:hypothetical protein
MEQADVFVYGSSIRCEGVANIPGENAAKVHEIQRLCTVTWTT